MKHSTFVPSFMLLVVYGCGGGASSNGSANSPKGQVLLLSPQGGTVATTDGTVTLNIPEGAVGKSTKTVATKPSNLPESARIVGDSFVTLTAVTLKSSGTLTIAYKTSSPTPQPSEGDLAIYRLEGKSWTLVGGKVDAISKTVSAPITSLGTFAVLSSDTTSLVAEATLQGGTPGVRVSWSPKGFSTPGGTVARWQIYRNDTGNLPVTETAGDATFASDGILHSSNPFNDFLLAAGSGPVDLSNPSPGNTNLAYIPPLVSGQPYRYQTQAVYGVPTTNSGGFTVGGVTVPYSPPPILYFLSGRATSGQATPITQPTLLYPKDFSATTKIDFQFRTVGTATLPLEYVIEVTANGFDDMTATLRSAPFVLSDSDVVTQTLDLSTGPSILLTTRNGVYWRVGVRNPSDVPGPVPDPRSGLRYLYSSFATVRPLEPPSFVNGL